MAAGAQRTLVTGADGFIGRRLCAELTRRGSAVVGLVRHPPASPVDGVEYAVGDLDDTAALRLAARGVTCAIHLAARVHVMRDVSADPVAEFHRVNVLGTARLLDAVLENPGAAVVFVSSVKAMGVDGPGDAYGASKLEAERLVLARCAHAGARAAVLRLPLVYGPEMRGNMLRLFDAVDRGVPMPLGSIRNRRSLAFVDNVVDALCRLSGAQRAAGIYSVCDSRDVSTPELIRAIAVALHRPARLLPVPPVLFAAAGRAGDLLSSLIPVPFSSREATRLLGSLTTDFVDLARDTQYVPPFSLADGLAVTAAWYRKR